MRTALSYFGHNAPRLVAVTAFGLTTSLNYAFSGASVAKRIATTGALTNIFASLIFIVAAYML